jgi:phosphoglycerol geranylgeranyltransferase
MAKEKPWDSWRHITKLDPDKEIAPEALKSIINSGTDAIMISGTQNITDKNVSHVIKLLKDYDIPKVLEPATPEAVMYEDLDYIFVPLVLNAMDLKWIIGKHVDWIINHNIQWERVVPEAYIVLNPDSAVAHLTQSNTRLTEEEVTAYALYAERYLSLPIVYIEYSGSYGTPSVVKSVNHALSKADLFYGGGIDSKERASEMLAYADVIVVGNVVYTNMDNYLATIP